MKMTEKEYLEHFGVRGMKWGVRKRSDDSSPGPVKKRSSDRTDKGKAGEAARGQKAGEYAPLKKPGNASARIGVQGMKRGERKQYNKDQVAKLQEQGLSKRTAKNTNNAQNRIDKVRMAAQGNQGRVSVLKQMNNRAFAVQTLSPTTALRNPLSTKKASANQLRKNEKKQQQIADGGAKVTNTILKLGGVSIKDLDYSI